MTLRIRVDAVTREEINRQDQFSELRDHISEAHGAGNTEMLARLQAEYRTSVRAYRESNQGRSPSAQATRSQPVALVASMDDVPPELTDDEATRAVLCYVANWNVWMPSEYEGEPALFRFEPGAFDELLARGAQPGVSVNHLPEIRNLGRWAWFQSDEIGQCALCVFDDVPAGWECLSALDSGASGGFSIYARPVRMTELPQRVQGLRAFSIQSALLLEAGPVDVPQHRGAIALDIGGRAPLWMLEQEAVERDAQVRRMWG